MDKLAPPPASPPTSTGVRQEAPAPPAPGRDIDYGRFLDCVHCGLCTSACPTYLETGDENDGPRGRIYLMRAVTDGRMELTPAVQRHLELCLDCRSCETACPSGVQYGRLIEPFRVAMRRAERRPGQPTGTWFERWVLYSIFTHPGRMRAALLPARLLQRTRLDWLIDAAGVSRLLPGKLRRMYEQLPRLQPRGRPLPELLPAIGPRRARVALFTGCVADAMFPQTHWATARVLQANGCEVVVPREQVCCGAIHYHSGSAGPAMELAARNAAAFDKAAVDAVLVNVAGCGAMLKDYGHIGHEVLAVQKAAGADDRLRALERFASRVRDASEFLAELGPIAPRGEMPLRATYHDACHLAHAQRVREQPRALLALVPKLELVPLPESDICCGAAGSYNLMEPDMSDRLSARKLENILSCRPQAVITGNAGCSLQIQAALRRAGRRLWIAHPMDVLDRSYRRQGPPSI
jgi:glycolate oxidase iron-sulfur subunit